MSKEKSLKDKPKQKEVLVHEFEINQFTKIVFMLTQFRGRWYINIRTWVRQHPKQQQWVRTQKGVFIDMAKWSDVAEGFTRFDNCIYELMLKEFKENEKKPEGERRWNDQRKKTQRAEDLGRAELQD